MVLLPLFMYAAVLVGSGHFSLGYVILGWILLVCSYGIVTIHNNISDIKIDRSNRRADNPLVTQGVTRRGALLLLVSLVGIGMLVSVLISMTALVWFFTYIFFGWLYSGRFAFKNKGFLAVIILGLCYGVMPWLLGYSAVSRGIDEPLLVVTLASFFFVVGIINLKDYKDIRGDALHKKMTILVSRGPAFTRTFILAFTTLAYSVLAVYSIFKGLPWACVVGVMLCLLNGVILHSRKIVNSALYRGKYGSMLRVLFFIYAASLWLVVGI